MTLIKLPNRQAKGLFFLLCCANNWTPVSTLLLSCKVGVLNWNVIVQCLWKEGGHKSQTVGICLPLNIPHSSSSHALSGKTTKLVIFSHSSSSPHHDLTSSLSREHFFILFNLFSIDIISNPVSSHHTAPYGVMSGSKLAQGLARQPHFLTNHPVFPYGRIAPY